MLDPAEGHEHSGKNHERQEKIGDRPGGHDRRAVAQRLPGEGQSAVDRRIRLGAVGDARDIGVAVELDISPKRQRPDSPPRAARINPRPELWTEAE